MKVIVRGYLNGKLGFMDDFEIEKSNLDNLIPNVAAKHAKRISSARLFMIEFEFPEMPENERFFRFGNDPRRMRIPVAVELE